MYVPQTIPITATLIDKTGLPAPTADWILGDVGADGAVYVFKGSEIRKTVDWGANWTQVLASGITGAIKKVKKLASGRLLVFANYSKIWITDANEANIVQVFSPNPEYTNLSWAQNMFGLSVYGDIIVASTYDRIIVTEEVFIVLSLDGGLTWTKILTESYLAPFRITHWHDVKYDPYENLIWVCMGDGSTEAQSKYGGVNASGSSDLIAWTNNWGKTWNWLEPGLQRRSTQIIPLPNCVLFGTDETGYIGTFKHTRPSLGTHASDVKPELSWLLTNHYEGIGAMGYITGAAITYGSAAAAYFGYRNDDVVDELPATAIYGTKDGNTFFPIWVDPSGITTPQGAGLRTVFGVFGPDDDGNLVACVKSLPSTYEIWKIPAPTWVWIEGM